jgi:hypothetical protein
MRNRCGCPHDREPERDVLVAYHQSMKPESAKTRLRLTR